MILIRSRCTGCAILIVISLLLTSCNVLIPAPTATSTSPAQPTATSPPPPAPTLTPTSPPPLAVLLAAPEADQELVNTLQTALNDIITGAGLRWQERGHLAAEEISPELRLVVAVPPDPGLAELAAAAPHTQFLAVGIQGLEVAPNLSIVGAQVPRPDQQGFIAGVIAAMLTPDWRVGVVSIGDTVEGRAARTGFLNGAVYFCGLCRQAYPPFYDYPLYIELPAASSSVEWQEAGNYMVDHYVQTVYVFPGAGDDAMLLSLATVGVNIISSGTPPENLRPNWVLSFSTDPLAQVLSLVPQLLEGRGGYNLPLPLEFTEINLSLFTPGKQNLANEILNDLLTGYIDTGVDLSTGESR